MIDVGFPFLLENNEGLLLALRINKAIKSKYKSSRKVRKVRDKEIYIRKAIKVLKNYHDIRGNPTCKEV